MKAFCSVLTTGRILRLVDFVTKGNARTLKENSDVADQTANACRSRDVVLS